MSSVISPLLHVPDVVATAAWYDRLGFATRDIGDHGGQAVFAALAFGDSEIMLSSGGHSSHDRRDADLYIRLDDIDSIYERCGATSTPSNSHTKPSMACGNSSSGISTASG